MLKIQKKFSFRLDLAIYGPMAITIQSGVSAPLAEGEVLALIHGGCAAVDTGGPRTGGARDAFPRIERELERISFGRMSNFLRAHLETMSDAEKFCLGALRLLEEEPTLNAGRGAALQADGVPRVTEGATFWLNDKPAPVVGRVSMDLITLDVTALPEAVPGAQIEILGPNRDIDTAGADGGTLGYEILTSIGRRAVRQYIG